MCRSDIHSRCGEFRGAKLNVPDVAFVRDAENNKELNMWSLSWVIRIVCRLKAENSIDRLKLTDVTSVHDAESEEAIFKFSQKLVNESIYIYIFRAGSLGVMESAASGILF